MPAPGETYPLAGKRVWVAGHGGMVGSALLRRLQEETCDVVCVDRADLDLRDAAGVEAWADAHRPQAVFVAAATSGGIAANDSRPAEFLHDNLAIVSNIVKAARAVAVEKLMFLGASCVYPRLAEQPMKETELLQGPLEPTNQWYAIAKIAGIKLCQACRRQYGDDFISVVPANLYGPGDAFDDESGHVIPALMGKIHRAKQRAGPVEVWGTGVARREFMYVEDAADALVFVMKHYTGEDVINVGSGGDISIRELAGLIAEVVGYDGDFVYDETKPDGMPVKRLDSARIAGMGWRAGTTLADGLKLTYAHYCETAIEIEPSAATGDG